MKDPILITGCARSGTSMISGIINLCGAFGGAMAGPNRHNKKGMFENNEIRQMVNKPYLKSIGCDPLGQKPLPTYEQRIGYKTEDSEWIRNNVFSIMKKQGLGENQTWFYKGAKICLVWPVWSFAFPDSKWIIVRRKKEDIANSCIRTAFMRAYKNIDGWIQWAINHEQCFSEMILYDSIQVKEIWSEDVINGNFDELRKIIDWLGLEYDQTKIDSFVDKTLWKSKI